MGRSFCRGCNASGRLWCGVKRESDLGGVSRVCGRWGCLRSRTGKRPSGSALRRDCLIRAKASGASISPIMTTHAQGFRRAICVVISRRQKRSSGRRPMYAANVKAVSWRANWKPAKSSATTTSEARSEQRSWSGGRSSSIVPPSIVPPSSWGIREPGTPARFRASMQF